MLDAGRPKIAEKLGNMLIVQADARFDLYHYQVFDEQVSKIISDACAVLVKNRQRHLLFDCEPEFSQTMGQCVLVNFFKMSVPQEFMDRKARFTDQIAKRKDAILLLIF